MDRMGWMGWNRMNKWDGMGWDGWDGWMIPCFEKVVSAQSTREIRWNLTVMFQLIN